jgi:hypothetical protein
MGTTLPSYYSQGGGNLAHVFFVAGYPWAVTDKPELIDALWFTGSVDNEEKKYLREKMFGAGFFEPSGWSSNYKPSWHKVNIFPMLLKCGAETWRADRTKGVLSSGGWSVKIQDAIPEVYAKGDTKWVHKADGDEIRGLEGLHRVAELEHSEVHSWGFLKEYFPKIEGYGASPQPPETITIEEMTPGRLWDRVDGLGSSEYVFLWIGKECIVVDSIDSGTWTADDPDYSLSICQSSTSVATGRGMFRTRPDNHMVGTSTDVVPIISDVPPSIVGQYCYLYEIPLTDDGSLLYDDDDNPVFGQVREGIVSQDITTQDGVTTVKVLASTKALELDTKVIQEVSDATEHLGKYVFTRSPDSGTTEADIVPYWQSPHLVVAYCGWTYDGFETTCKVPIWLCPPGESIVFDSYDELLQATKDECVRVILNESDDSYTIAGGFVKPLILRLRGLYSTNIPGQLFYGYMHFSGPLAWVLGMGYPRVTGTAEGTSPGQYSFSNAASEESLYSGYVAVINDDEEFGKTSRYEKYKTGYKDFIWNMEICDHKLDTVNPFANTKEWLSHSTAFSLDPADWDWDEMPGALYSEFRAEYYIGWDWINQQPGNFNFALSGYPGSGHLESTTYFYFPAISDDSPQVPVLPTHEYFDEDSLVQNEKIDFGAEGGPVPVLTGELSENPAEDSDMDCYILDIKDDRLEEVQDGSIMWGMSLFYIPILVAGGDLEEAADTQDPHRIKKSQHVDGYILSDIFRTLMGETRSPFYLAPELTLSHVPFFTTSPSAGKFAEDHVSIIDWDSMNANFDQITAHHTYRLDIHEFRSVLDILKHETLMHACGMVREWDSTNSMFRWRFRKLQGLNKTEAYISGRKLTETEIAGGIKKEIHNFEQVANAIEFEARHVDLEESNITFKIIGDRTIALNDDFQVIEIKPELTRFVKTDMFFDVSVVLKDYFRKLLRTLSRKRVANECKLNRIGVFKATLGREILITDPAARVPRTHAIGMDDEPCRVISWRWNIDTQKCDIQFTVGGGDASFGWAPSCRLESGNFTTHTTYWTGTPNDHDFTRDDQALDLYYFDCYDLWDPANPVARSCGCGNYSVFAYEEGSIGATPLEFTANIYDDSGTMKITLTGADTASIDTGKDYVITFAKYDDCEDCQKYYIFGADNNLTIGTGSEPAMRWVI